MKTISAFIIYYAISVAAFAQVLYDNGSIVNFPGQGFGGADASVVLNGGIATGADHVIANGTKIADDFTVTSTTGWKIDSVRVFAYALNSDTTSCMTDLRLSFWNGHPDAVPSKVWGDESLNVLLHTAFTGIYRVFESNKTNTQRPVMSLTANIGGAILSQGTYWMIWQGTSSGFSGPYAPPIFTNTVVATGNSTQYSYDAFNGNWKWSDIADPGLGNIALGLPFIIYGSVANTLPEFLSIENINIYPNPFKGEAKVSISPSLFTGFTGRDMNMIIYNSIGQQVKSIEGIVSPEFVINMEKMRSGLYIYKLYSADNRLLHSGKLLLE